MDAASNLKITVPLSQGAYLEFWENDDGTTHIRVKAGQNNRMNYGATHPAKFTDILAVLNGDDVDKAADKRRVLGYGGLRDYGKPA